MTRPKNPRRKKPTHRPHFGPRPEEPEEDFGGEGEEIPESYDIRSVQLAEGREEVVKIWGDLRKEEKAEVLDLTEDEVNEELKPLLEIMTVQPASLLQNPQLMGFIREQFVEAMHHDGKMMLMSDPISVTLASILEKHLITAYIRKASQVKVLLVLAIALWVMLDWHWIIRLLLLAGVVYLGISTRDSVKQTLELSVQPFVGKDPDLSAYRFTAFTSGFLALCLGNWASWYYAAVGVVFAPVIVIEITRVISAYNDHQALLKLSAFLTWCSSCIAIYFALYSWTLSILLVTLFFPRPTRLVLSFLLIGVTMACQYTLPIYNFIYVAKASSRRAYLPMLALVLFFYISWFSWIWTSLCLLGFFVLLPPTVRTILGGGAGALTMSLSSQPWDIFSVIRYIIIGSLFGAVGLRFLWHLFLVKVLKRPDPLGNSNGNQGGE